MQVKCGLLREEVFYNNSAERLHAGIAQNGKESLWQVGGRRNEEVFKDGNLVIPDGYVLIMAGGRDSIVQWLSNYGSTTKIVGQSNFWVAGCRNKVFLGKNQTFAFLLTRYRGEGGTSYTPSQRERINGVRLYRQIRQDKTLLGYGGKVTILPAVLANEFRNYFDGVEGF